MGNAWYIVTVLRYSEINLKRNGRVQQLVNLEIFLLHETQDGK